MDGLAAAEHIAGARIAPVIILTAFSQRDLVERARAAGAMAYLVKPFQKSDLVPAIEIALSRFAELHGARGRGREPDRPAGDPQAGRAGQGHADGGVQMTEPRGVQVDPAGRDGQPDDHERGRRADHRGEPARRGPTPSLIARLIPDTGRVIRRRAPPGSRSWSRRTAAASAAAAGRGDPASTAAPTGQRRRPRAPAPPLALDWTRDRAAAPSRRTATTVRAAHPCAGHWYATGANRRTRRSTPAGGSDQRRFAAWTSIAIAPNTYYGEKNIIYAGACRDDRPGRDRGQGRWRARQPADEHLVHRGRWHAGRGGGPRRTRCSAARTPSTSPADDRGPVGVAHRGQPQQRGGRLAVADGGEVLA